ncbi:MAG: hypothetical protein MUF07_08280 [Steroidobacteraceae bacterium]|jgi:hypothetical protein|nr:hypothetical protein [Steroidobacteraceae bacterium]
MLETMLVFVFLPVVLAIGLAVWRGLQVRALAERGVPVQGTVVKKLTLGAGFMATRRIAFEYVGPDGRTYHRAASVSPGRFERHVEGAPLSLYCLPDAPGTSAEAWMVEAARDAMAKQKRRR